MDSPPLLIPMISLGRKGFVASPYEILVWMCLIAIKEWASRDGRIGGISYFFESGFKDQGKASSLMERIFSISELREDFMYRSHAFVDKAQSMPSQAADILVWQKAKHLKRLNVGFGHKRADFNQLITLVSTSTCKLTKDCLQLMISLIVMLGGPNANEIARSALKPKKKPKTSKKV